MPKTPTRKGVVDGQAPDEPAGPAPSAKPDWKAIEREYRAGVLSVRAIARQHHVSEGALRKRSKVKKWTRAASTQAGKEPVRAVRTKAPRAVRTKSKGGQPTKYDPAYVDQARRVAMLGHTNPEMAGFFGVSPRTFDGWLARHDEFLRAVKEGREHADAQMAESLYRRGMGYSHKAVKIFQDKGTPVIVPYTEHYPPDTAACIFWLKNRQRAKWRDKVEQEVSGPDGGAVKVEHSGLVALDFEAVRAKRAGGGTKQQDV